MGERMPGARVVALPGSDAGPRSAGAITDIACFEPADAPALCHLNQRTLRSHLNHGGGHVTGVITPVDLDYLYAASPGGVGVLPRPRRGPARRPALPDLPARSTSRRAAPARPTASPTAEEVELPDTGTVTTFCIVNVPFLGQRITPPYVSAYVLLDGADIAFLHLILDIPADEVRMGMRVEAVWKPREEWGTTIENISHFAPTGEPDADYETYKQHL